MLTVKAPIECKYKALGASNHECFYHKIADSYTIMSSALEPEDLLHVVNMPPEYFFGGEDETNIFHQTNVQAHQENKLEVINNLINRISVSESAQLTYQDRVYITDILQKIGIHNVSEFMKQVQQLKEEQNETNQLTRLYWNHAGELRQLVEQYQNTQTDVNKEAVYTQQSEILHLHEEILNRLQTGAIYQTVHNFNSFTTDNQTITNTQLRLSEQVNVAQQILLQKLKSEARDTQVPLSFLHENYYEEQQLSEDQITEQTILSQLSSAVLLDLTNRIYQNRLERQLRGGDHWLHMEQSFYQTAENTMQRMEQRMHADYVSNRLQINEYNRNVSQERKQEIQLLNRLFVDRSSEEEQTIEQLFSRQVQQDARVHLQQTQTEAITQELTDVQNISVAQHHTLAAQLVNRLLNQKTEQTKQINNHLLRQTIEQQNRLSQTNIDIENRMQLDQRTYEAGDAIEQQSITEHTIQNDQRSYQSIEQELSRINRENINNQSKYIQMMEGIKESLERPAQMRTPEQLRRESLQALEHPQTLLEQLRSDGEAQRDMQQARMEQALSVLPEQTREIYEIVREYLEAPQTVRSQMEGISSDPDILIRDIHEATVKNQQMQLAHLQQEKLQEQTKETIERWQEAAAVRNQPKQVYETTRSDVTLIHKAVEQQLNEDEVLELIEQNRMHTRNIHTEEDVVTNQSISQHEYKTVNTQQITEQAENVNELVRQGVQRELGALSDKIYQKLERRLETEKRRRGY